MTTRNKRTKLDYTVEKTVETMKILEVLEVAPASIDTIIKRVGFIPSLERDLKSDAVRRVLITLEILGYAECVDKKWRKGFRQV